MMRIVSTDVGMTEQAGCELGKKLRGGMVVALYGELGAGKTAFVRGLARGVGYGGRVTSPTFALVNEYLGKPSIFHFDMYRLSGADDLFDIGWEDYLERDGVCVVEWSERVHAALPHDCVRVRIEHGGDGDTRIIEIEGI